MEWFGFWMFCAAWVIADAWKSVTITKVSRGKYE